MADARLRQMERDHDEAWATGDHHLAALATYRLGRERMRIGTCPRCGGTPVDRQTPDCLRRWHSPFGIDSSLAVAGGSFVESLHGHERTTEWWNNLTDHGRASAVAFDLILRARDRMPGALLRGSTEHVALSDAVLASRPGATVRACEGCGWSSTAGWSDPSAPAPGDPAAWPSYNDTRPTTVVRVTARALWLAADFVFAENDPGIDPKPHVWHFGPFGDQHTYRHGRSRVWRAVARPGDGWWTAGGRKRGQRVTIGCRVVNIPREV